MKILPKTSYVNKICPNDTLFEQKKQQNFIFDFFFHFFEKYFD